MLLVLLVERLFPYKLQIIVHSSDILSVLRARDALLAVEDALEEDLDGGKLLFLEVSEEAEHFDGHFHEVEVDDSDVLEDEGVLLVLLLEVLAHLFDEPRFVHYLLEEH